MSERDPNCTCPTEGDRVYSDTCPIHKESARVERTWMVIDGTEADFWRRLREAFPEEAAREGPPETWKDNPRYKHGTHAGLRIRNAAEAMMKDWLAVYGAE